MANKASSASRLNGFGAIVSMIGSGSWSSKPCTNKSTSLPYTTLCVSHHWRTAVNCAGANPGLRYTARQSCKPSRLSSKSCCTKLRCGHCACNSLSRCASLRLSATVTCAPMRTHQRAMAKPDTPAPSTRTLNGVVGVCIWLVLAQLQR